MDKATYQLTAQILLAEFYLNCLEVSYPESYRIASQRIRGSLCTV